MLNYPSKLLSITKENFLSNKLDADHLHERNAGHVHPTGFWQKHHNNPTAHLVPVVRSAGVRQWRQGRDRRGGERHCGEYRLARRWAPEINLTGGDQNDCSPDWPRWCVSWSRDRVGGGGRLIKPDAGVSPAWLAFQTNPLKQAYILFI